MIGKFFLCLKMGLFHSPKCRLLSMLCLTFFFFLVEIIVGYLTNSTALIADSFHMLSDVVALVIAYVSVRVSNKTNFIEFDDLILFIII